MLDVKKAVSSGLQYLKEIFPASQIRDVRLEEVMLTDDERYWMVTFSYILPEGVLNEEPVGTLESTVKNAFLIGMSRDKRFFKTIKLRRDDGEFFGLTNLVA